MGYVSQCVPVLFLDERLGRTAKNGFQFADSGDATLSLFRSETLDQRKALRLPHDISDAHLRGRLLQAKAAATAAAGLEVAQLGEIVDDLHHVVAGKTEGFGNVLH